MPHSQNFPAIQKLAAQIKLLVLDVDGVLTDRRIAFVDNGSEWKAFNAHDGFGLKMLVTHGIHVGVITTRVSPVVERRMHELGVQHLYQGQVDKRHAFNEMLQKIGISAKEAAFLGDDLPDLPLMRQAGLGIAVADAAPFVLAHADYRTKACGGAGAVRETCELIMEAQNKLQTYYEQFL